MLLTSGLAQQLQVAVLQRTNRQIRDLAIEVDPSRIILLGEAHTYHAKQLAQESVRSILPHLPLVNRIRVA